MCLALCRTSEMQRLGEHGYRPLQGRVIDRDGAVNRLHQYSDINAMITQCAKYHGSMSKLEQGGWSRQDGQGSFLEEITRESNLERPEVGQMKKNEGGRQNRWNKAQRWNREIPLSLQKFLCKEIQTSREKDGSLPTYQLSFCADGGQMSPHAGAVPFTLTPCLVVIKRKIAVGLEGSPAKRTAIPGAPSWENWNENQLQRSISSVTDCIAILLTIQLIFFGNNTRVTKIILFPLLKNPENYISKCFWAKVPESHDDYTKITRYSLRKQHYSSMSLHVFTSIFEVLPEQSLLQEILSNRVGNLLEFSSISASSQRMGGFTNSSIIKETKSLSRGNNP